MSYKKSVITIGARLEGRNNGIWFPHLLVMDRFKIFLRKRTEIEDRAGKELLM